MNAERNTSGHADAPLWTAACLVNLLAAIGWICAYGLNQRALGSILALAWAVAVLGYISALSSKQYWAFLLRLMATATPVLVVILLVHG
jgi:hypothetical protein